MAKFRSKPVEIEAERFMGTHSSSLDTFTEGQARRVWISPSNTVYDYNPGAGMNVKHAYEIATLEGKMLCHENDWIIKGTEGEFYPCKDTVFQRKYENA